MTSSSTSNDLFAGTAAFDEMGGAVALNIAGNVLVAGARKAGLERQGQVTVYELASGDEEEATETWQIRGLTLEGQSAGDAFGASVAVNGEGDVIAVGAPLFGATNGGQVRVYTYASGAWEAVGFPVKPNWSPEMDILGFGTAVALDDSGTVLAVGAQAYENTDLNMGYVQVFVYNGDSWMPRGNTLAGFAPGDGFGANLGLNINGRVIAVGADGVHNAANEDVGHAYIYYYNEALQTWDSFGALQGLTAGDAFGCAVDISYNGRIVAVGSRGAGDKTGLVRVYQYNNGKGEWERLGQTLPGGTEGDEFGYSVALSSNGKVVAVGAHNHNEQTGLVSVYEYNPETDRWQEYGTPVLGTKSGQNMGTAVALSGNGGTLATGTMADSDAGKNTGSVHVWKYEK